MSTSALTTNDICARVRAQLGAVLPLTALPRADHNISLCIWSGLERLARSVRPTTDRHLLTCEINVTPASGELDLTAAGFAGVFLDTLTLPGSVTAQAESAAVFKHAPSLDALRASTPADPSCVWYNLTGKVLTFKHPTTGALNAYSTALTLRGFYIPEIGNASRPLPQELDGQLIDRVAELVKALGGLRFLQADEEVARAAVAGA
jgi:hypothetical protein